MNPKTAPTIVLVCAIFAATALEGLAIWKGQDGKFFAATMGLIGALGGVTVGRLLYYKPPTVGAEKEE